MSSWNQHGAQSLRPATLLLEMVSSEKSKALRNVDEIAIREGGSFNKGSISSKRPPSEKRIALSSLAPLPNVANRLTDSAVVSDPGVKGNPGEKSGAWQTAGMSLDPFRLEIFNRLESGIPYPQELVAAKISGDISLSFTIDAEGKLLGPFREVTAEDRILKVHVFRTLRRRLNGAMHSRPSNGEEKLVFFITIHFSIDPKFLISMQNKSPGEILDVDRFVFYLHAQAAGRSTNLTNSGGGLRNQGLHRSDDASAAIQTSFALDPNGVFSAGSNSGDQSIGVGINLIQLGKKLFQNDQKKIDPLEKYRADADY